MGRSKLYSQIALEETGEGGFIMNRRKDNVGTTTKSGFRVVWSQDRECRPIRIRQVIPQSLRRGSRNGLGILLSDFWLPES
jgi:hypothetical protein